MDHIVVFGVSFLFNAGVALLILRHIYRPAKQDRDYVLMFLTFNVLAFLIASLLQNVDLGVGLGLSLFAIFSILRFRTDPIPIRAMTYLFAMMALPVINALLIANEAYTAVVLADLAVAGALALVERGWGLSRVNHKTITYERIEWVKPEHAEALLADLRARTGLNITGFEIGRLDFLRDTAEITITYVDVDVDEAVRPVKPAADYSTLFSARKG